MSILSTMTHRARALALALAALLGAALASCQNWFDNHLIDDKGRRDEIARLFEARVAGAKGYLPSIEAVMAMPMSTPVREAFMFLYAYMPLSDLAMHDPGYVLDMARRAVAARERFAWGKSVPDDVFLHFVLPYRVNNEHTDEARGVFQDELAPRVGAMSMYDAALEVNHWCHEKVAYKASDARTSGPLSTVRTALGRCGEESTFTVAAMRSVGIPARQVYTPRWAHTDDNHAWVEVWIDGRWRFLGACEPDPELDMGWFAAPAKRTMMTRTFVFGQYAGAEPTLSTGGMYSELNLLANYAPTRPLTARVVDAQGAPVPGARVEYQLYNYAEFFPLARRQADSQGTCTVEIGHGDLMLWASHDGQVAFAEAGPEAGDTLTLTLAAPGQLPALLLTLTPPRPLPIAEPDPDKAAKNALRIKYEDSVRAAYEATFIDSAAAAALAAEVGAEPARLWALMHKSRGNWQEIKKFVTSLGARDLATGLALLENVSEKDLRDVPAHILLDHLRHAPANAAGYSADVYNAQVLSPRIHRELVTPWRGALRQLLDNSGLAAQIAADPAQALAWIDANIAVDSATNYYNVPMSPDAVCRAKAGDPVSRDILFVALCRAAGVAARLEPATKKKEYLAGGQWRGARFQAEIEADARRGANQPDKATLRLSLAPGAAVEKPQYYTHYTLARFDGRRFATLDYEYDATLETLPATLTVDAGRYRLTTGLRQSDGTVLARVVYFDVAAGRDNRAAVEFAPEQPALREYGQLAALALPDIGGSYGDLRFGDPASGVRVVALVDPGTEPAKHLFNDLAAVAGELSGEVQAIHLVVAQGRMRAGFDPAAVAGLPANASWGHDTQGATGQALAAATKIAAPALPAVAVADAQGRIVFWSEGYSIGLGAQILKTAKALKK